MNAINKLKDLLVSSEQIHTVSISQFLPLDLAKVKRDLRLEEKAKDNGSRELPSSESDDFDEVEHSVINLIETERARCLSEFNDHLATYSQRLSNLNLEARLTQVTLAAKEAIGDFKEQINQGQCDLVISKNSLKEHASHIENFKRENGITRPAHYPTSKFFNWGIIAFLSIAEALANGLFLAVGNEFGLFGGVGEAAAITFLNIGGALFIGRKVVPWLWHNKIVLKSVGVIITVAFVAANLAFNVFVAHYRDALENAMSDQAAIFAVSSFIDDPFNIHGFTSWVMVGIGGFFALISLLDGFSMDDPYPNYGHWDRLRCRAYENYADKKAYLFDDLKQTRDIASNGLAKLKDDLVKRRQEHDSIIANRLNLLTNYDVHQNYLESCGRELITLYRSRNRESRTTRPPKHFDRAWNLNRKVTPSIPAPALSDKYLNEIMTEASEIIQFAIRDVMEAFDQAIESIDQINTIISEIDHGSS